MSTWECTGWPDTTLSVCKPKCWDGVTLVSDGEVCDEGPVQKGCKSDCTGNLTGWDCTERIPNGLTICKEICGDSLLVGTETCDDGGGEVADGVGCSPTCWGSEQYWNCITTVDGIECNPICGDGVVLNWNKLDTCDEGPTFFGCSADCTAPKDGFNCSFTTDNLNTTKCIEICGDGKRVSAEETCDDGTDDDLGCKKGCKSGFHE